MTRQRTAALTVGAAASAAIILIAFFKAPVLPVAAGAVIAVALLLRRAWRQDERYSSN
jgi:membrane protein YqaA with SNARE-associated domain